MGVNEDLEKSIEKRSMAGVKEALAAGAVPTYDMLRMVVPHPGSWIADPIEIFCLLVDAGMTGEDLMKGKKYLLEPIIDERSDISILQAQQRVGSPASYSELSSDDFMTGELVNSLNRNLTYSIDAKRLEVAFDTHFSRVYSSDELGPIVRALFCAKEATLQETLGLAYRSVTMPDLGKWRDEETKEREVLKWCAFFGMLVDKNCVFNDEGKDYRIKAGTNFSAYLLDHTWGDSDYIAEVKKAQLGIIEAKLDAMLSETQMCFADMKFQWDDGTFLQAHKAKLAAASPYFETALSKRWEESNPDCIFKPQYSRPVMKVIIAFVYWGNLPPLQGLLKEDPTLLVGTLYAAQFYELPRLKALASKCLESSLSLDNWKECLIEGQGLPDVKEACFDFVTKNWAHIFIRNSDETVASIKEKHPGLWEEMAEFCDVYCRRMAGQANQANQARARRVDG